MTNAFESPDETPADALRHEGFEKIDGILEANLCPVSQQINILFDPDRLTDDEVIRHAKRLEPYLKKHFGCCLFKLGGRAGSACAIKMEKRAETIHGVRRANASFISGVMSVQFDQAQLDESALMQSLKDQGARVEPWQAPTAKSGRESSWVGWFTASPVEAALTFATLLLLIAGWLVSRTTPPTLVAQLCYLGAYISGGWFGVQSAWASLKEKTIDIDLLMILAALGAAYVGAPLEGGTLLFLFSFSNLLQRGAMDRARKAIHALMKLRPSQALTRRNGDLILLPIDDLKIGDIVIVRPGESIPLDGEITHGESALDESSLTGESMPVNKGEGEPVFAGTINTSGGLELRVSRLARDSVITRLIQMVEHAQSEKAETQRFLERAEQHYAAGVILFTLALIFVPLFFTAQSFDEVFYRAMTVMVVASPCALIISTPASILSAIGGAARNGVLFKGGLHLERTSTIRVVAFDKTGTLTNGKPVLTDLILHDGTDVTMSQPFSAEAATLLGLAAAVEMKSEHPLARAIVAAARAHNIPFSDCASFQSVTGRGVRGNVGHQWISIGDRRMFENAHVTNMLEMESTLNLLQSQGKSSLIVAAQHHDGDAFKIIGLLALADTLREDAADVVRQLRENGIERIVMLTGDHRNVANAIGREAGVDEVHAELMPEDKWRIIQSLKASGPVAMIGDGVNDAPALAAADIGIAMGAAGTDVAMETADVVLMGEQLKTVAYAIAISKAARRIVRQNLVFSMSVIVVLVIAALGYNLALPAGVIGHEGSTVVVCLNGLRLLRFRA
jgi:Cd2+/Zn2+-exporting ATPase